MDSWSFKAAETFLDVTNIVWAWDKFVNICLQPRIREFIHTSAERGIAMLRVDKFPYPRHLTRGN